MDVGCHLTALRLAELETEGFCVFPVTADMFPNYLFTYLLLSFETNQSWVTSKHNPVE